MCLGKNIDRYLRVVHGRRKPSTLPLGAPHFVESGRKKPKSRSKRRALGRAHVMQSPKECEVDSSAAPRSAVATAID
jgi:hypothetical protein